MSNVPGIINLTSSAPPKTGPYPVRSLFFIANLNPQLALNDYVTRVWRVNLSIFRTRLSLARKVYSRLNASNGQVALNANLVTCKLLSASRLRESVRSVLRKSTICESV